MITISGYILLDLLYSGRNSHVYRARRERDGLAVILKIPPSRDISIRENLRFQHEYNLLSSVDLPRIINVYDLIQCRASFAIVEEDYGACDMATYLQTRRPDLHDFFPIAIQMAEALAQLHQCRIVHKDIHLANYLIHPDTREVKLTDFGLSSLIEGELQEACSPDQIEGNLSYISPEQTGRINRLIDYRSDLYSLGICYYRILTGVLPFTSGDPMELVHSHIARQPIAPGEVDPAIPRPLSSLVMRLLAKKPEDRYQSARGLIRDLETMRAAWLAEEDFSRMALGQRDVALVFQVAQKIYGRDREVAVLLDSFERVTQGHSELLLVGGYSGIGKTSLVNEVHKALAHRRGRFISGKHDQFQRDIPFSAFIQAFRGLTNQILAESEDRIAAYRQALLDALGGNARVILDVLPEVEHLIGPQPPAPELGLAETQNRFVMCVQRFVGVFARREHPLVVFLDDLQWADAPSLHLMRVLAVGFETPFLLLLGAYRDNEVSPSHPLMLTLGRIREAGAPLGTVLLAPLGLDDLTQLTADTLNCPPTETVDLAALLLEKTAGNPFFVAQMLKELHERGVFRLRPDDARWHWDVDSIRTVGMSDNVVELMAGRIGRLRPETRRVLQLAACIGNRFRLADLATIHEKPESATSEDLWEALQATLILPSGDDFRFLHDRVQQAAYSLIAPRDVAPLHLRIGRLLLRHVGQAQLGEALFDILPHFHAALGLLDDPEERAMLSRLNLQAGRKAKASTAYEPAMRYFRVAMALLPAETWRVDYGHSLDVYREQADAAYLLGEFQQAEALLDEALSRAADRYDQTDIHLQKITQYNLQGKYNELMDIARSALTLFGVDLPQADDAATLGVCFDRQMSDYASLLNQRSIPDLIHGPEVTDPDQNSVIRLMAVLTDGAYIAVPTLFPYVVMEVVNRSMRYGHNSMSAIGFSWATVVIVQQHQDYRGAFDLGTLGMRLIERFPNPRIHAQVTFLHAVCAMHWFLPLSEQIATYKRAYQHGVENGNLVFAGYARTMIPKTVLADSTIDKALEENNISVAFYEKLSSPFRIIEQFCTVFLKNLKGDGIDPVSLSTDTLDEDAYLDLWTRPETLFGHGLAYFLNFKIQLLFHFGRPLDAWRLATTHADWMRYIPILYETTVFTFFRALAAAACLEDADDDDRRTMAGHLDGALADFAIWSANCPSNFSWQHRLLRAESERLAGRETAALDLFDQAATLARTHAHPQGVALSQERAGRLHLRRGDPERARTCLEDAGFHYFRWGANAKVMHLRDELAVHFGDGRDVSSGAIRMTGGYVSLATRETAHPSSSLLDLNSVLKSSLALSREIHLDGLLRAIMAAVIENAGAERGILLLPGEGDWFVASMASVTWNETRLDRGPLTGSPLVCESVARFVIRSGQDVVLDDAGLHPTFKQDPHVRRNGVRSVLCLPLQSQNRLSGVLYLENNLVPAAFNIERTRILKMLAAQAAISIENAILYEKLETSERKYRSVFEDASDLIFLTTDEGRIVDINPACMPMLGYTRDEMLAINFVRLYVDPEERDRVRRLIDSAGGVRGYPLAMRRKDGTVLDVMMTAGVRRDSQGRAGGYQGIIRDVTAEKQAERLRAAYSQDLERQVVDRTRELSEANSKLQKLSECDGLTGIANRRKFDTALATEWNRALRTRSPVALAMIDVDHFKAFNDQFGHQAGDDCLKRVAQAMSAVVRRASDLLARYGGEEFAVILPGASGDEATLLAQKLRDRVNSLEIAHPNNSAAAVVTVSVGVASRVPEADSQPTVLIQAADDCLYQAKQQGRNRVVPEA